MIIRANKNFVFYSVEDKTPLLIIERNFLGIILRIPNALQFGMNKLDKAVLLAESLNKVSEYSKTDELDLRIGDRAILYYGSGYWNMIETALFRQSYKDSPEQAVAIEVLKKAIDIVYYSNKTLWTL